MAGEKTVNLDIDPIFKVCLIIFAIAAVIAIGAWINHDYIATGDEQASTGDSVSVNYIGTFYAPYGEQYAVVFDTSYSDIANNDSIAKSNDFTKKSSYSPLTYTIGGTTVLEKFGDAVIGHKVGDKVKVELSPSEGYIGVSTTGILKTTGNVMDASIKMSKSQFSSAYSTVSLVNGQTVKFDTKYSWAGYATLTDNGTSVNVTYVPTAGTYKVYESGETIVNYIVTSVSGDKITYDIEVKNPTYTGGNRNEIQMIKLDLGDETIYLTNISSTEITYKTGSERLNQTLFFEIELVSINE